jgi:hypothetical protein
VTDIKITGDIAVLYGDGIMIGNVQDTLDLIGDLGYNYGKCKAAIKKAAITENFFRLSSGVAGEIAQKVTQYGFRLAIVGDFSQYTSKPLHDYIYESNKGGQLLFVPDEQTAIAKLSEGE